jgi:uncharacterized protein (DUF2126 family)
MRTTVPPRSSDFEDITVTITTADEIWANTLAIGARGTLVATHKDAKNATGGAITFTLVNAVVVNTQLGGQHRQFGRPPSRSMPSGPTP